MRITPVLEDLSPSWKHPNV